MSVWHSAVKEQNKQQNISFNYYYYTTLRYTTL